MANDANIKAVITAEDKASSVLRNFGDNVSSAGTKIKNAFEIGGAAVIGFAALSVKAFSESEDLIAQTNAVLKSTGGVAGVTADQVTKLATAWQKQSKYSDEAVRNAENVLLTFTNISSDIFPQTTQAVLDISTALHEDLQSASIQVGKALQDPVLGVTALRRVGVNFSDKQRDVIKSLVDTGKSAEAQQMILQELNKEFGGSAKAAGDTFSGSLAKLKNSFNDVQESIGGTIVKGLTPLAQRFADFVNSDKFKAWLDKLITWLQVNLPIAAAYIINTLIPELKRVFDDVWPVIALVIDWGGKLFKFLADNTWVVWALVTAFAAVKTAMFLEGAIKGFQAVMAAVRFEYGITSALITSPITMPAIVVVAALASLFEVIKAARTVIDTINVVKSMNAGMEADRASTNAAIAQLQGLTLSQDPAQRQRAYTALHNLHVQGYAEGGIIPATPGGRLIRVAEGGQDEAVIPLNKAGGMGGTINININAGAFMGSDVEARKYAQLILNHMKTIAGAKNMTLGQLIGS